MFSIIVFQKQINVINICTITHIWKIITLTSVSYLPCYILHKGYNYYKIKIRSKKLLFRNSLNLTILNTN